MGRRRRRDESEAGEKERRTIDEQPLPQCIPPVIFFLSSLLNSGSGPTPLFLPPSLHAQQPDSRSERREGGGRWWW